ncbi:MAG: dihydrodipicolinate synthase family protein [Pirellulales bacterium]
MHLRIHGLLAAVYTPLLPNGNVNLIVVERQSQHVLRSGLAGVFVCGTTGECHSLTVAERQQLAARWVSLVGRQMAIVVHVGHNCLPNAQSLAAHAQQIGATAIAAMAPSFFRPTNVDELIDYCAAVAGHAPRVPFYYYDIPSLTGVHLPAAELLERGLERIPTLAGVKYTNPDLPGLQACLAARDGRFNVLYGFDEQLLPALQLGAHGGVGGTYGLAPELYKTIFTAHQAGDLETATTLQQRCTRLVQQLAPLGVVRAGKAAMKCLGIDCGSVRLPLRDLADGELESLRQALTEAGLLAPSA